jgi:hypothetical protein
VIGYFFILKGGKSEFWPLCLPSVAGRKILGLTSANFLPWDGTFLKPFQNVHVFIQ